MKQLYDVAEISKQGHHKFVNKKIKQLEDETIILSSLVLLRTLHPEMGAKKMYDKLKPESMGRDLFIKLVISHGLGVPRRYNYAKTTQNARIYKYKNLIAGITLNDINQLWVSDITYFRIGERYYYLTFIEDVYSRKIVGYVAYETLQAEANIIALTMALNNRDIDNGLIHHSDRGVQYHSNSYTDLLQSKNIKISMCNSVYENAHIERINGIIKNEYLRYQTINTHKDLKHCLNKAVVLYNKERPHWSLGKMSPMEYEKYLLSIPLSKRKGLQISTYVSKQENNNYLNQMNIFDS